MKQPRKAGFYWVKFEGQILVGEFPWHRLDSDHLPHWHIPNVDGAITPESLCAVLSERLEPPK